MHDAVSLIAAWPTVPDFARDIGVKPKHAHVMKVRNRIAPAHWAAVVAAARSRRIKGVTLGLLERFWSEGNDGSAEPSSERAA